MPSKSLLYKLRAFYDKFKKNVKYLLITAALDHIFLLESKGASCQVIILILITFFAVLCL